MPRSSDRLEELVRAADADGIIRLMAGLSEDERRALAPRAWELRRRHDGFAGSEPLGFQVDDVSRVAVYGTASVGELRAASRIHSLPPDRAADAVSFRPTTFLVPFADWLLASGKPAAWDIVRPFVREGLVPKPSTPWYTLRMLEYRRSPSEMLADDPSLVDDEVWRLFEIEGSGELSLAAHDKYSSASASWQAALVGVAAQDPADRERLLDDSLSALARDMAAFRAGWFSRFHEALEPSVDERVARIDAYTRLLRSPTRATVSFAVAAVDRLARAGRLPREGVVERLGPVLSAGPASSARMALRILQRAARDDGGRSAAVARTAAEGLAHELPEVQAAALDLIERVAPPNDDELVAMLRDHADTIHASQRQRSDRLLATLAAPSAEAPERPVDPPHRPAAALPPGTGPAADTASADVERDPAPDDPLDPSRAVTPIVEMDELVEVLTGLLETASPPEAIERALEGVSRFGRGVASDFERRTAPLVKRAGTLVARRWDGADPRLDLACLVLRWARSTVVEPRPHKRLGAFLAARVQRIGERSSAGIVAPLLATPTHQGGWIEPIVLVERLLAWPDAIPPDHLDAVAAMLRLGLARRDMAFTAAEGLGGELGDAVRYALGGAAPIGPTASLWIAAARARSPSTDDTDVDARHPGLGPDAGRAATIRFVEAKPRSGGESAFDPVRLELALDPPLPSDVAVDLPTVLLLADEGWRGYQPSKALEQRRWEATAWPSWRESWFAVGALWLARNVDWWSAQWANRVYLEPLLDPWTDLGPMARNALGIALGASEAGERGLAADAAIAAIADGRLDATALDDCLSGASGLGVARPRRWATALSDVSSVSPRHASVVQEASARAIGSLPAPTDGDAVGLLRLVNELVHRTGTPLSSEAAAGVVAVGEKGLSGRLARSILAASQAVELPGRPVTHHPPAATHPTSSSADL